MHPILFPTLSFTCFLLAFHTSPWVFALSAVFALLYAISALRWALS